jgi:hypothetical protein
MRFAGLLENSLAVALRGCCQSVAERVQGEGASAGAQRAGRSERCDEEVGGVGLETLIGEECKLSFRADAHDPRRNWIRRSLSHQTRVQFEVADGAKLSITSALELSTFHAGWSCGKSLMANREWQSITTFSFISNT